MNNEVRPERSLGISHESLDDVMVEFRHFWDSPEITASLRARLDPGIPLEHYRVVRAVAGLGEDRTVKALATALAIDPSTASRLVNSAVDLDIVDRRENPKDRRHCSLELTERGQAAYEHIRRVRVDLLRELTAGWPDETLDTFIALSRDFLSARSRLLGSAVSGWGIGVTR